MALRFQLINEFLGPLTIEKADPIGINEMTQTVKRSTDNEGVVYEIIFDIDFIKEGRRYLKQAFENHGGIDAEVLVNVYEWDSNLRRWKLYANGRVNFAKYDVYEDKLTVNIEQVGFQRRVLNLIDTDVDIEKTESENGSALPAIISHQVPYHSKTILKKVIAGPQDSNESQHLDVFKFELPANPPPGDGNPTLNRNAFLVGSLDTNGVKQEELSDFFKVQYSYIRIDDIGYGTFTTEQTKNALLANLNGRFEIYRATEAGNLNAEVSINIRHRIDAFDTGGQVVVCGNQLGNVEILYWFEVRDINNIIITLENIVRAPTQICGTEELGYVQTTFNLNNINIEIGHKIYVYHTVRIWGDYSRPVSFSDGEVHHNFIIQASPELWESTKSYGVGDRVISGNKVWSSVVAENTTHTPVEGLYWTYLNDWMGSIVPTGIRLENITVAPVTTAKTFLLYDVFLKCCQYITNQIDCFKSDLLGRTELGYAVDGEGALIGWTNGANLRKLEGKTLFANLKELIDFVDAVYCVGFGFEIVNGRNILRLEKRAFFYNKNVPTLFLGKVYNIKKRLDPKKFFKEIEYGYQGKLDIGKVNAVDEFNTLRRASIPIINTKNKLKISVKTRTSGYQIEHQRRLQFSSMDSKLDDENFAVVLIRDGAGFRTKQDEGYVSIINVLDPATGYNYDISPARCLKNWYQFIASMLIRSPNKIVKFAYGEVNYRMASKKVGESDYLREDGEFDLTGIEPLYEPFIYEFKKELRRDGFQLVKTLPYGVFTFEDQFGEKFEAYLSDKGVEHDSFKNMGDFELLKVYRA